MAKSDTVVVAHRNHKGATVHREFTPEIVDAENPAHKGKTHVDLANEFIAKHKDKGAHIVHGITEAPEAAPEAAAPAQQSAPAIPGVTAGEPAPVVDAAPAKAAKGKKAKAAK